MSSPTQRSLQHCRKNGWIAGVVEKWNQYARIRQDLFGPASGAGYVWIWSRCSTQEVDSGAATEDVAGVTSTF